MTDSPVVGSPLRTRTPIQRTPTRPNVDRSLHQSARATGLTTRRASPTTRYGLGEAQAAIPASDETQFWDSSTGRFDGATLRRAIVTRGWTVREFAVEADISLSCLYCALQGRPAIDRTAIAIFQTLLLRDPVLVAV